MTTYIKHKITGAILFQTESANLRSANLRSADLRSADLRSANLYGADLRSANLGGAIGVSAFCITCTGALTVFKKTTKGVVELLIPCDAARMNAIGSRKCRAEYAVVVAAPDGARSLHDSAFEYIVGATVRPDSFDPDVRVECSHGIHFFITREEAEAYT